MSSRRSVAIGGVRSLTACAAALLLGCAPRSGPEFGFQAAFEKPCKEENPDTCCGLDNCGPNESPWLGGPHTGFAALDLARIARESLAWFRESSDAAEWRENSSARLELVYPSDGIRVRARFDPALESSWEQQLAAWFERCPPRGDDPGEPGTEFWSWRLEFGGSGDVRGYDLSDEAAVARMRLVLARPDRLGLSREPGCSLDLCVRRTDHEMDSYGSEIVAPDHIADLPQQARDKRSANDG